MRHGGFFGIGHSIGGGHGLGSNLLMDELSIGRPYDHRVVMRLAKYVRPYARAAIISLLAVITYTAATVAIPLVIKQGIDSFVIPSITTGDFSGLNKVALAFIGVALIHYVANYTQFIAIARVGQGILYSLRTRMFNHLQGLSPSFFHRTEVGRIMSRVQNDVLQLQETFSLMVLTLADILSLVGIVAAMLLLHLKLALITLSVIPVLFIIMAFWQRYAKSTFIRIRRAIAIVNGALNENITGVRVVQSLNRQTLNLKHFEGLNREHLDANVEAARLTGILQPTVELLTGTSMAVVVFVGGLMVVDGTLAVGVLIAFALYIQRFFDPIRNLTMQYTQLQRSMASGARIFELLDVEPEVTDLPNASTMPSITGDIRYEDVSFSYVSGIDVLKDINVEFKAGETVAIVGPTGAGKSTLVTLAHRFYDVTKGRITVDGYDIREVERHSLVGQMSMVLQEPFLFSGTVYENIRYSHRERTDEEVVAAAKLVGAHDFIMALEKGYDTTLQERGSNLSIGQRQLIGFARAIVNNPRILILDEATASVDTQTEVLIQQSLKKVLEGRTSIVIAHRLSTIRNASKILVMDQGRIVETGNHEELLKLNGIYTRLYVMNFGEDTLTNGNGTSTISSDGHPSD